MPERMPDKTPDAMSEYMSGAMSDYMSDKMSDRMSEYMSGYMTWIATGITQNNSILGGARKDVQTIQAKPFLEVHYDLVNHGSWCGILEVACKITCQRSTVNEIPTPKQNSQTLKN